MINEHEHIRVYRTTLANGKQAFIEKKTDGQKKRSYGSIRSLAHGTRWSVELIHKESAKDVYIDLFPMHSIECLRNRAPSLHTPLTELEQAEFWKYFLEI